MIFCSTGGFGKLSGSEALCHLLSSGVGGVELSGGRHEELYMVKLKKIKESYPDSNLAVHNYYPVPKKPFVINLASGNTKIVSASMQHMRRAIRLSAELGSRYYSFHAGFLVDPEPNELGKEIKRQGLANRFEAMEEFLARVSILADYAQSHGIRLLIENNVLTKSNMVRFGGNPLLMTTGDEILELASMLPSGTGVLIDVGHLNVTCRTLELDRDEELSKANEVVEGYHLSDNCGNRDSNMKIHSAAWFARRIKRDLSYYVIEVYNMVGPEMLGQVEVLREILGR